MIRQPPRSTRTDTLFPYTTLFRSEQREDDVPGDKPVRDIGGPHQLSVLAGQAGKGEREENGHRAERADRGRYMRGEHELAEAGRHRHLRPGGAWPPRPSPDDRGSSHTRKGTVDKPTPIGRQDGKDKKIGRAACRERVCQYV